MGGPPQVLQGRLHGEAQGLGALPDGRQFLGGIVPLPRFPFPGMVMPSFPPWPHPTVRARSPASGFVAPPSPGDDGQDFHLVPMVPAVTPGTGFSGSSRAATWRPRRAELVRASAVSGKGTLGQSWRMPSPFSVR